MLSKSIQNYDQGSIWRKPKSKQEKKPLRVWPCFDLKGFCLSFLLLTHTVIVTQGRQNKFLGGDAFLTVIRNKGVKVV